FLHPITTATLAVTAFVLAGQLRERLLAAAGSILGLGVLILLFVYQLPADSLSRPVPVALLTHATLSILASWWLASRRNTLADVFAGPLRLCAEVGSVLAFLMLLPPGNDLTRRALYALWAAGLWLTSAWRRRSSEWFTLFQVGLSFAALLGARAGIDATELFAGLRDEFDPRLLQVHGIVLGTLGLGWLWLREVRICRPLFPTTWAGLDRLLL